MVSVFSLTKWRPAMHDFEPTPIPHEQALREEYQRIVYETGDSGVTSAEAMHEAAENVERMIHEGHVEPPNYLDSALPLLQRIDKKQKSSVDGTLKKLARGQQPLEFDDDPWTRRVATLGNSERKSWEYITQADLRKMYEERFKNVQRVTEAFHETKQDIAAVIEAIAPYGTIGSADRAGVFPGEIKEVA